MQCLGNWCERGTGEMQRCLERCFKSPDRTGPCDWSNRLLELVLWSVCSWSGFTERLQRAFRCIGADDDRTCRSYLRFQSRRTWWVSQCNEVKLDNAENHFQTDASHCRSICLEVLGFATCRYGLEVVRGALVRSRPAWRTVCGALP